MANRGKPRHPDILTPREWEIVELLCDGLSNEAIGLRLGITERTAKFHVSDILGKLGLASREDVAAWLATREAPPGRFQRWLSFVPPVFVIAASVCVLAGLGFLALGDDQDARRLSGARHLARPRDPQGD